MTSNLAQLTEGVFRKTATIEARRWDPANPHRVTAWIAEGGFRYEVLPGDRLGIGTLESGDGLDLHSAKPGDWVIRGQAGEFYACDATIFASTYTAVA